MRSIISLLLFIFLVTAGQPVPAADNTSGQPSSTAKPPLKVLGNTANTQKQTVQPSLSPLLSNRNLVNKRSSEDIRDIQGPLLLPESIPLWIPILIGAILLLLVYLFFFIRKIRKKTAPPLPAHEIALAELAKAKGWMTESKGVLYAQRLSEILRQYIESRFFVQSTRQTTAELLAKLQSNPASTNVTSVLINDLQGCLEWCDMAKFAHRSPGRQSMIEMESSVGRFIKATRPAQQTEEDA